MVSPYYAATQVIVAGPAVYGVSARAATQEVICRADRDVVIALVAECRVVRTKSGDGVYLIAADH